MLHCEYLSKMKRLERRVTELVNNQVDKRYWFFSEFFNALDIVSNEDKKLCIGVLNRIAGKSTKFQIRLLLPTEGFRGLETITSLHQLAEEDEVMMFSENKIENPIFPHEYIYNIQSKVRYALIRK